VIAFVEFKAYGEIRAFAVIAVACEVGIEAVSTIEP
jgi:hypothetical protein